MQTASRQYVLYSVYQGYLKEDILVRTPVWSRLLPYCSGFVANHIVQISFGFTNLSNVIR